MFEQILVPVDGSKRGVEAIQIASRLAERFDARVCLLRVEDAATPTDQLLADNLDLSQRAAELRQHGLRVRHSIEFGQPEHTIAEIARMSRPQLIVLAPHQRSLAAMAHAPSVTARLLGHLTTPLLVWPEHDPGKALTHLLNVAESRVIVPLDGSALAERALPIAIQFARMYARPLLLLRVVPTLPQAAIWPETFEAQVRFEDEGERDALTYLNLMRQHVEAEQPGVSVEVGVLNGQPDSEIERCAQSRDGSLVVLSSHGRGGIQRALHGSVATHLARHAEVPLLVIPPGAPAGMAPAWAPSIGQAEHDPTAL